MAMRIILRICFIYAIIDVSSASYSLMSSFHNRGNTPGVRLMKATVERATMSDSMANAALNILVDAYAIHTDSEKIIVHFRKKYEEKYEEFRWSMIQTCGGYGIAARRYVTLKVNLSNGSVVEYIVFTNDKVQGA